LKNFEKENPGLVAYTIAKEKKEHKDAGHGDFNLVNEESHARHVFELPEELINTIDQAYPLMFRDKNHFKWFVKNFKFLMIADKY
jgi:hypothetical protein